jgi:hypothetical protein
MDTEQIGRGYTMERVEITTNNVPRKIIDAWDLSESERNQFDYLNWPAIEAGTNSASFFRYRGELYDLGEFMRYEGQLAELRAWHGYMSDSFFSGMLVQYTDGEHVIIATYYVAG